MIYSIVAALVLATRADAAALRSTSPLLESNPAAASTEALIAKFSTEPVPNVELANIGAFDTNIDDIDRPSCSHSMACNDCVNSYDPDYCAVSGVGWDRSCQRFCAPKYCTEKCTVSTTEVTNFLTNVQQDGPTANGNQPTSDVANPCEREVHYNDNIWISMAAWNDVPNLHRAIQSIQSQVFSFKNVHLVVYEDASDEMLGVEKYARYPNVIFLESENKQQQGAAYAKWRLFDYIRNHADLDDYVMVVDGDDQLADTFVLSEVRLSLMEHKPWFAWGKINGKYSDQCGPMLHPISLLRHVKWFVCHPRIMKAHLLHRLEAKDFQRDDGTWLQKSTDRPFIYTFMEEAGPDRILFLDKRRIYNYTYSHNNGLIRFKNKKEVITGDKVLVNSRPIQRKSPDVVHVIACVWQRSATDEEFFTSLMNSYFKDRKILDIHICNNIPAYQAQREKIAQDLNDNNHGHKITIHDMGSNTYGYGRFLLAKQLQKVQPMDYIIMVDNDQRVVRDTLSDVYNVREPLTFKTWYGKNWNTDNKDYWHPSQSLSPIPSKSIKQHPEITSWQYGGTGMSIVDANAFRIEEVFQIPQVYKNVEDMWLSYVLQLAGYKIGRLFTIFDVVASESKSGQWAQLKKKKNRMFEDVGYLRCGTRNRDGLSIESKLDSVPLSPKTVLESPSKTR